jgi:imidazole glycerol-phosphate synthase subunit HisH
MIAIIDYGMGNLRSVQKAFAAAGHEALVTRDVAAIREADRLVLPGVGAFGDCMANLTQYGLVEPIRAAVSAGKPFLGICLGLQLLFTESEEFGPHAGLGIIPGRVRRFPFGGRIGAELKVPHIGWNGVSVRREAPPLKGIHADDHFYFVHSYVVEPTDPSVVATMTDYGGPFVSSVWRDNIYACQFHPEKSQALGLRIIDNFARWS